MSLKVNKTLKLLVYEKSIEIISEPTYELVSNVNSVDEGDSVVITFITNQDPQPGGWGYTITGVSSEDISNASLTGTFSQSGDVITLDISEDSLTEGNETLTITLDILEISTSIVINDTSVEPLTYSLNSSTAGTNEENSNFTIFFTTNDPNPVAYTITGVSSSDISGASLTGFFNGSENIIFTSTPDLTTEGLETFVLSLDNGEASVSVNIFDSSRTPSQPPVLDVNTGITLDESTSHTIITSELSASDSDNFPSNIYFVITAIPAQGNLVVSGTTLTVGDRFSQLDLNQGNVVYTHTGIFGSDEFRFQLGDLQNTLPESVFSITINSVTPNWRTIINDYPNLTAAYSSTYLMDSTLPITTPAIRIKNLDNSVEQDIAYTSDRKIDESALISAVTSNESDIRCITLYNQISGGDFVSYGIDTRNPFVLFNNNKRDGDVLIYLTIEELTFLQNPTGLPNRGLWTIYLKSHLTANEDVPRRRLWLMNNYPFDPEISSVPDQPYNIQFGIYNNYNTPTNTYPNGLSGWFCRTGDETPSLNPGDGQGNRNYLRDNNNQYKVTSIAVDAANSVASCATLYSPDEFAIFGTKYGFREETINSSDFAPTGLINLGSLYNRTNARIFTNTEVSALLMFNEYHSEATMIEILDRLLED